jgi:hypothetical protein
LDLLDELVEILFEVEEVDFKEKIYEIYFLHFLVEDLDDKGEEVRGEALREEGKI